MTKLQQHVNVRHNNFITYNSTTTTMPSHPEVLRHQLMQQHFLRGLAKYQAAFQTLHHERTRYAKIKAYSKQLNQYLSRSFKVQKPKNVTPVELVDLDIESLSGIFKDDFVTICNAVSVLFISCIFDEIIRSENFSHTDTNQ